MTTEPTPQRLDPQDIAAVACMYHTEDVNKYLACGWIVTAIVKRQDGPESYSLDYHLGWPRNLGEPNKPETGIEAWLKRTSEHEDGEKAPF